jgi:hypothetical protein
MKIDSDKKIKDQIPTVHITAMISFLCQFFIRNNLGCFMAFGRASLALSCFAASRPSYWFVLYLNKTGE